MRNQVVTVSDLVKTYRKFRMEIGSFELEEGHLHVLIGPNGAGKSTLLRLLIGLSLPDEGMINLHGLLLWDNEKEIKLQTGYVAQEMDFPLGMKCGQCLDFISEFYPQWSDDARVHLVKLFDLDEGKRFRELSPGNKMRLLLIAGFARMPKLLLLDEPFASLDPLAKENLNVEILKFLKREGTTVLLATNELNDIQDNIDKLHIIRNGEIAVSGTQDELISRIRRFAFTHNDQYPKMPDGFPGVLAPRPDGWNAVMVADEADCMRILTDAGANEIVTVEADIKDVMRYYFDGGLSG